MAYNNYFPQNYYQPYYMPNSVQNSTQNVSAGSSGGITWVQGENAAKSFPVAAGQSVLLMDSEDSVMYIKSTDQSGMPQPLRIFEYKERTTKHTEAGLSKPSSEEYVLRSEFDEFCADVKRTIKGMRNAEMEGGEG